MDDAETTTEEVNVGVVGDNDAPEVEGTTTDLVYVENAAAEGLFLDLSISDLDDVTVTATIEITGADLNGDVFVLTSADADVVVYAADAGSTASPRVVVGACSLADMEDKLAKV